eukprot:snap_masked-scaffold_13-processed-gene-6.13-mRNA-1 protein AED:1.00 eAED:1.00 QI:0/0/0/0/1/1/2/0/647
MDEYQNKISQTHMVSTKPVTEEHKLTTIEVLQDKTNQLTQKVYEHRKLIRLVLLVLSVILLTLWIRGAFYHCGWCNPLDFETICAKEKETDILALLKQKANETPYMRLNTFGISKLPAYAFQCNYNFKQQDTSKYFIINLEQDLVVHKNAFKGSNGKKEGSWITEIYVVEFITNGFKLTISSNTFEKDVFPFGRSKTVHFLVNDLSNIILLGKKKDEVSELRVEIVDDTKKEDAVKALKKFSNWKASYVLLPGFEKFTGTKMKGRLSKNIETLYIGSQEPMEYPNSFIDNLPKIRELSLGVMNSLSLPEKEVNTLEKLPNDFLKNYPILQSFFVYGLSYYECENSLKNRLGAQNSELNVRFSPLYLDSCVTLDGTVDLSPYENDFCPVGETMQTVLNLNLFPERFLSRFKIEGGCFPPYGFSLSSTNFSNLTEFTLSMENVKYFPENAFITEENEPIFLELEEFTLSRGKSFNLTEGILGIDSFPSLEKLVFWFLELGTVHPDMLKGNENKIKEILIYKGSIGDNSTWIDEVVPKLLSVESLYLDQVEIANVPEGIPNLVNLTSIILQSIQISKVLVNDFCTESSFSSLRSISLSGNPVTFVEDDAFLHCDSLLSLTIPSELLNETEAEFKERTGACSNSADCLLYY